MRYALSIAAAFLAAHEIAAAQSRSFSPPPVIMVGENQETVTQTELQELVVRCSLEATSVDGPDAIIDRFARCMFEAAGDGLRVIIVTDEGLVCNAHCVVQAARH